MVIVREKDMSEREYMDLFEKTRKICASYSVECIPHLFVEEALSRGIRKIHLPLWAAEKNRDRLSGLDWFGVSVHSAGEAEKAAGLGASYVMAGHVFETDCKKGLEGRGLPFIEDIAAAFDGPVFAVGGIDFSNMDDVLSAGAEKVCMMSGFMNGVIE